MDVAEQVNKFLTDNRPSAFCDDCIADKLQLSRRQQAFRVTSALGTPGTSFVRQQGTCSSCGEERKVTNRA
jgi:hypothetical protein